ncbi:MAG: sulfotransferase [Cyanobacteria bacterium P01_F01_bin.150]
MSTMPNFLIIGAAKGGTTSLYHYLSQHPQIYMSTVKEPRFFALEGEELNFNNPDQGINRDSITQLREYQNLFKDVKDEIAIGEASPLYLYSTKAADRIRHYIPDVKLIAILRDPSERAYSCYTHLVRENYEPLSFEEGLCEEFKRIQDNWAHLWHYRQGGYYYSQLKPYFEKFSRDNIRIYRFEDLNNDSMSVVQDIYQFLGVDDAFIPDLTRMNVSGKPKIKALQTLLGTGNTTRSLIKRILPTEFRKDIARRLRSWNLKQKGEMPADIREKLIHDYREDILQLQELINTDLSAWLE